MPVPEVLRGRRGFGLLLTGRSASLLGSGMAPVGLAFAVLAATGGATDLGLVLGARALPLVLLVLVGGVIGDRRNRRRVLLACDATAAAAQAVTATLVLTGHVALVPLMAMQAVGGAAQAFAHPAFTGLVPQVVEPKQRQRANALLALARNAGTLIGAPLGGLLSVAWSPGAALAVDAASFAVSALCWAGLRVPGSLPDPGATAPTQASMRHELVAGWREVRSRTWLWGVIAQFTVLVFIGEAAFDVLAPVIAKDHLGGASAYGLILAVEGAGAVAGAAIATRLRVGRPIFIGMLLMLLYAPELLLLGLGAPLPAILLGAAVAGFSLQFFGVLWETTMQEQIAPELMSRVAAYDMFGSIGLFPLGLALMGTLAGLVGVHGALLLGAASVVLPTLALLAVPEVRQLRRLEHAVAPELVGA